MSTETRSPNRLHFAVRRFHATLSASPFLSLLAVTGLDLRILSALPRLVS